MCRDTASTSEPNSGVVLTLRTVLTWPFKTHGCCLAKAILPYIHTPIRISSTYRRFLPSTLCIFQESLSIRIEITTYRWLRQESTFWCTSRWSWSLYNIREYSMKMRVLRDQNLPTLLEVLSIVTSQVLQLFHSRTLYSIVRLWNKLCLLFEIDKDIGLVILSS